MNLETIAFVAALLDRVEADLPGTRGFTFTAEEHLKAARTHFESDRDTPPLSETVAELFEAYYSTGYGAHALRVEKGKVDR